MWQSSPFAHHIFFLLSVEFKWSFKAFVISTYILCLRGARPAGWINLFLLFLSSAEFMSVGSECEEELQEECGLSQLETRLQHRSEHVRPAQVRALTGQCSWSLVRMSWFVKLPSINIPSSQPEVSRWRTELAYDKKFHCSKQFIASKSLLDSAYKHTLTSKN